MINKLTKKLKNASDIISASDVNLADAINTRDNKKHVPFAIVESYKNIRTSITFLLSEANGNSMTVTSANAGEGKSTTSANLAVAFSQLGKKVLIIDADLRKASLHRKFNVKNVKGLAEVLQEEALFEEVYCEISPELHILTAGVSPANPSELLDSDNFSKLMEKLKSSYDYVLIDTPPLNVVSDSLIVAPHTSGVVFVVRDGYTPHYSIKKAIDVMRFSNINILGSVMNGANPKYKNRYIYRKYSYVYNKKGYSSYYGPYSSKRKSQDKTEN